MPVKLSKTENLPMGAAAAPMPNVRLSLLTGDDDIAIIMDGHSIAPHPFVEVRP